MTHTQTPWHQTMHTCRLCGDFHEHGKAGALVKYSVRHYAHAQCAMEKWGAAFFDRLTPFQARQFPVLFALRAGHIEALKARAGLE